MGAKCLSVGALLGAMLVTHLFLCAGFANACIGNIIYVGTQDEPAPRLLAELIKQLINERTGTNVKLHLFDGQESPLIDVLSSSEKDMRVDIYIRDTKDSTLFVHKETQKNKPFFSLVRGKNKLIWFEATGGDNRKQLPFLPLYRETLLKEFPLLPRILDKLIVVLDQNIFQKLLDKVQRGANRNNVAKSFLRGNQLI